MRLPHDSSVIHPSLLSYNTPGSGFVFFTVETISVCDTSAYRIDLSLSGAKEIYAAILTALALNTEIVIEISNETGCTGWGSVVQSITILR